MSPAIVMSLRNLLKPDLFSNLPFPVVRMELMPVRHREEIYADPAQRAVVRRANERRIETALLFLEAIRANYEEIKKGRVVSSLEEGDDFFSAHARTLRYLYDPSVRVILAPVFFLPKWSGGAKDESVGAVGGAAIKRREGGVKLVDFRATTRLYKTRRELDETGCLVKSREPHAGFLDELAFRVFIARQAGLPVTKAEIVHWGAYYVYSDVAKDPHALLYFERLSEAVESRQEEMPFMLEAILEDYRLPQEIEEEAAKETSPSDIARLYRIGGDLRKELEARQIGDLREIPDEMLEGLSPIQKRQIQALREGKAVLQEADGLKAALDRITAAARVPGARLSFLDFETATPAAARIVGTSNEQTVTLQFSNHFYEEGGGDLCHFEYLYDGDPLAPDAARHLYRETAMMILEAVGPAGPILVYSESFEKSRLRDLARGLRQNKELELAEKIERLTIDAKVKELVKRVREEGGKEYADRLEAIVGFEPLIEKYIEFLRREEDPFRQALAEELAKILENDRIVDLLPLVRNHLYHPDFDASFSLKRILKVLCPAYGYDDLEEVTNGEIATLCLEERLDPATTSERRAEIRRRLAAYCRRDTLAEVAILQALFALCGAKWPFGEIV
jgi:hypothetical protein